MTTPLISQHSGHLESVKWLVANRAGLEARDLSDRTPLDVAMQYEHCDVIDFLTACEQEQNRPESSFSMMRTPRIDGSVVDL